MNTKTFLIIKKSQLIYLAGFLLIVCFGFVNTNEPEKNKKERTIEVTGSADVEVPSDNIELIIQLSEYSHEKRESMEHLQLELFEKLEKAGIAKSNVQLKDMGNQYYWRYYWDWYYWNNPSSRPFLTKQISVKMESMSQADKVVESLKMRGITNIYLGKSSNKNITEYRKKVKLEAIKAAKEKAQYMLEAIDEKLGGVISIKEVDGDSSSSARHAWGGYGWPYYYGYGYYGGGNQNSNSVVSNSSMNAGNMNIGGGTTGPDAEESGMKKIKLRYEVEVMFEIASK